MLGIPTAPSAVAERLAVALLAADPRVRQLTDGRWSLVAEACGSPLIEECAFAVVDVETTGMRAWGGERIAMNFAGSGGAVRDAFLLEPGIAYLNHGSYGATPRVVLAAAERWRQRLESQPVRFMQSELPAALRRAADRLAAFMGARGEDLAFVVLMADR